MRRIEEKVLDEFYEPYFTRPILTDSLTTDYGHIPIRPIGVELRDIMLDIKNAMWDTLDV